MKIASTPPRPYRQTARAAAAEQTRRRIIDAFVARLGSSWFDEITLDAVAQDAGVTVQTIVRRFAGKDGLMQAAAESMSRDVRINRHISESSSSAVATAVARDYEQNGDLILRLLDQEGRHPALKQVLDQGRRGHREWLADVFESTLRDDAREARLDSLVVATDLYTWRLLRRDMRRSARQYRQIVENLIEASFRLPRHSA